VAFPVKKLLTPLKPRQYLSSTNLQEALVKGSLLCDPTYSQPLSRRISVTKVIPFVGPSGAIGASAISAMLTAIMPKCPICWMALMGALGVSSTINALWMRPLAVGFLLLPVGALLIRVRRRGGYGPFLLGLAGAVAMYLCKFVLFYDPGVYLSGAALVGASIWNVTNKRRTRDKTECRC
jgi:hypothetical protein